MIDLKKIPFFDTLTDADFKEIVPYFSAASFRKRDVIFSEGDLPDWLYIVLGGKIKITKVSMEGKEIILEVIQPNDFFGGVAVLKGFPYPANAIAMEDSKVLKISRSNLLKVLDRFPNLMYRMALQLGERMKGSHESLKNIALERVESRIASLLLKLADKTGQKLEAGLLIDMKLTKQDIAEMVGTTIETSIRTMSKFKKSGILSEKEGKIVIKNIEKLRSL
ncbi:MAG TPA: Crp/Fnr family transcriptional regulator [Thermodesulfovibrionales bacterium]|jgi:CRP/FNR family transcriptional regulator|nr:Crp/Fnr family transcriptional regulator [Thermodesulfovibrionales bacterium]